MYTQTVFNGVPVLNGRTGAPDDPIHQFGHLQGIQEAPCETPARYWPEPDRACRKVGEAAAIRLALRTRGAADRCRGVPGDRRAPGHRRRQDDQGPGHLAKKERFRFLNMAESATCCFL